MKITWDLKVDDASVLEIWRDQSNAVMFMYPWTPPYFGINTPSKLIEITSKYICKLHQPYNSAEIEHFPLGKQK